jgi:predicted anti-sigma-YlaC factor YlaD
MKSDHIITLIENKPLHSLTADDLKLVEDHVHDCAACREAFAAARISQSLLEERAAAAFEPSPFFHTRVMAALRERQAAGQTNAFARLWRASSALVSSMVVAVVLLAAVSFAAPETHEVSALSNSYSAEEVILNQTSQLENTAESPWAAVYGDDEDQAR